MLQGVKLGKAITHFRELRGLNQEQLALAIGTNPGNLSRMINGRQRIQPDLLERIAHELRVQISELYAYAENPDPNRVRWFALYENLTEEEREYALRLLERPPRIKHQS